MSSLQLQPGSQAAWQLLLLLILLFYLQSQLSNHQNEMTQAAEATIAFCHSVFTPQFTPQQEHHFCFSLTNFINAQMRLIRQLLRGVQSISC